jgi:hypothetical protein
MGLELGRVSGPLLTNNLIRNGINLAFSNTDVSTPVLQLDVSNGRIGINNDSPTHELLVSTYAKTTNLIVDTSATFQNFNLATNTITHASSTIYIRPDQSVNPTVVAAGLKATNVLLFNNTFTNTALNTNFQLSPSGTGRVVTNGSVLVNGALHATGDITFDGDITLGDTNADNISFNADVNSDIIPDDDATWGLGSPAPGGKRWNTLYTELVHSGNMIATNLTSANNLNPVRLVGNTRYVSVNGNDTLAGNHAHSPYRTVRAALAAAQLGEEVVIFPGTYTEIFPLVVPKGVSVRGAGIRSVTIQPTVGTQTNDCFLLNGETTVEFLTVANFYYNSAADTGYAFRFNTSLNITSRSPYISQVTVLTQSSGSLAAGRGALADGSAAQLSSNQPSMLFHSATFITKGADGLVIKNGARVEWLNSFTYFANRGIYLYSTQSSTLDGGSSSVSGTALDGGGSTSINLQAVDGGTATTMYTSTNIAELRSINSANVYGNYGVVGDGDGVVAYLVGHNFGYIGAGLDSRNDASNVIQANEVITSNGAKVYYTSDDHGGSFRVGDVFSVDQTTGIVTIVAQAVNFANGGSISLAGAGNTYIDSKVVQTGNISIHDNNIDSLSGSVNFFAANGTTTWTTDVFVTGNVGVTGNFSVEGNITVGNQSLDTVSIVPRLGQTIKPDLNDTFSLGSNSVKWKDVYLTGTLDVSGTYSAGSWDLLSGYFEVPNIKIDGNTLNVTQADTDLNLQANGSGGVIFDKIKITNTTISSVDTNQNIILSPNGTGQTVINTTTALTLPVGTNSTRTLTASGEIRFNSATALFDARQPSGLVSFKDLYDSDRNTYITAELTPGTNDNIIRFGANGTVVGTVDTTKLYSNTLWGGNVRISSNNIDNISSSTNVNIKPKRVGGNYTGVTITRVVGTGAEFAITIENGVYKTGVNVVTSPGSGYDVGTTVILPGSFLSGISPDNNCYVKVTAVDVSGGITNAEVLFGLAVGTDGIYENNVQTGVTTGTSASFDITWAVDATSYTMTLASPGTGYSTGERYKILGSQLGGTVPQNDIVFVINATSGAITSIAQVQIGLPFSPSTGNTNFSGTILKDNTINTPANGELNFVNFDKGYLKFASNGLVVPVGNNIQRRLTPDVGELRYNTDIQYAEIYNGTFWQPVKGSQPELGVEDLLEIMELWTLVLG